VPHYNGALAEVARQYGVDVRYGERLVKVDGQARKVWFEAAPGQPHREESFELLHIAPP
jgi:sulfide:quinone oxidoreductase